MALEILEGLKLKSVTLSTNKESLAFVLDNGATENFGTEGDCCSYTWIEHLSVPEDIDGAIVISVDENAGDGEDFEQGGEYIAVYQSRVRTDRGDINIEYRNSSNGYYGGWLTYAGRT